MNRISLFLLVTVFAAACGALPFLNSTPSSTSSSSESVKRAENVRVNGREVSRSSSGDDDEDEDDDRPKKKSRKSKGATKAEEKTSDIGTTCHKNNECEAKACWVGSGSIGYCTKMCNSWSDCPTRWECKKPGNAPQKICMQGD